MRVSGSTTTTTVPATQPVLREGSRGTAAADLQRRLNALGFNCGAADGIFGPKTKAAVMSFQRSRGIGVDGVVGPQTWGKLLGAGSTTSTSSGGHPTISMGARGPAVVDLQKALVKAGFNPGPADGVFGQQTKNAVLAFQRAHNLVADGICGPKTWSALSSSYQTTPSTNNPPPASNAGSPTLKQGAKGPAVVELQQLLKNAGCNPGPIDGQFGPQTSQAVFSYQISRGLTVDGIVGPQTWNALRSGAPAVANPGPATSGELRQRIVQVAQSQIGTLENGSSNSGPCLKYANYFGRGAEPWCADFASWVLTHAVALQSIEPRPLHDGWHGRGTERGSRGRKKAAGSGSAATAA